MEIRVTTNQILKFLYILSWIIFSMVCFEAGGLIVNAIYAVAFNPDAAHSYWNKIDLSALYAHDKGFYLVLTGLMSIPAVMRAIMFYLIVKILHDKKLDLAQPFSTDVRRFILNVAYLAFGISMFSFWGRKYVAWFIKQGIAMPDIETLRLGGADVWLFMGVTLVIIAQIFKRGIEIQAENELTV